MPIYEYLCAGCGHRFEVMHIAADSYGSVRCPACGGKRAGRQLSTFAVAAPASAAPMCERTGACASPDIPGCKSGACGL